MNPNSTRKHPSIRRDPPSTTQLRSILERLARSGSAEGAPPREEGPVESQVRRIVADHLGIGPEELTPDVSITDDLAADSLDLLELGLAVEAELGVSVPDTMLEDVRTYQDLVDLVRLLGRHATAARRMATLQPAFVWVRIIPVPSKSSGTLERVGYLTPYTAQVITQEILRAGPGVCLELIATSGASESAMGQLREDFAWLARRGIRVVIRRNDRTSYQYPDAAA